MKKVFKFSVNPFEWIAGGKSLIIGLLAMAVIGTVGALSATYFDGVLDAHVGAKTNWLNSFVCLAVDWAALVAVFGIAAMIFAKSFRFIDILGTFALAQTPRLFMALGGFLAPKSLAEIDAMAQTETLESVVESTMALLSQPSVIVACIVLGILSVVLIVWLVTLYYNAFRISANLKSPKVIYIFIAGIILAEILSKIALGIIL
ncbi:MAG: hypothetical protein LBN23_07110 [Paludibacter sp.]|jgi:hypothetical protein|nr:hypothetical protein [Paludibacter sp.]